VPFGLKCAIARAVGECDQDDHAQQNKR